VPVQYRVMPLPKSLKPRYRLVYGDKIALGPGKAELLEAKAAPKETAALLNALK
jgi:hypothetical protein